MTDAQNETIAYTQAGTKGRALVCLVESGEKEISLLDPLVEELQHGYKCSKLVIDDVKGSEWKSSYEKVIAFLDEQKIRQAHIVSIGAAGAIAQALAVRFPGRVRSLVLINATSRAHAGLMERVCDWLEERLPLGLPFRVATDSFHGKPFRHRIRCPALILTTESASQAIRDEAESFATAIPTSWYWKLERGEEFASMVKEFHALPVKAPQKNVA